LHLFTIPTWVFVAMAIAVAALALWKGGWAERAVAAAVLVEWTTENDVLLHLHPPPWFDIAWDFVILGTCVACALRSSRYWTVAASSFALLETVTSLMHFVPGVGVWAYLSAERVWSALLCVAIVAGVGWARLAPMRRAAAKA